MIYILTVHWKVARWLLVQRKYIKKNTPEKHRLHVHISPQMKYNGKPKFDKVYCSNESKHWKKLDMMASEVCERADKRDILIFMDGDAFPVKRHIPRVKSLLKNNSLVAIQRLENAGECHPHPSYCATTVGFWEGNKCTWGVEGQRQVINPNPPPYKVRLKDTGGKLWSILHDGGFKWHPLLRSNKRDYHPVFFGLYGDMIYHHGGAFFGRIPRTHLDCKSTKEQRQPWRKAYEHYSPLFYSRLGADPLFFLPLIGKPHCWSPSAPRKCPGGA